MSSAYTDQRTSVPVAVSSGEDPASVIGLKMVWKPRGALSDSGDLVDRVLEARGLHDRAEQFLNPSLRSLHEPGLIPGLERSARRLLKAIEEGERIVVYGDYDVDGVTASAILIHTIRAISPDAKVRSYIPHRIDEGYGLNERAISTLHEEGADLIVSVDCGITAIEPARRARELGLDLIITDHHNPPASVDDLPDAYEVVHPRHPDSQYPFGELCGAGVAYKLAWQLCVLHSGSERVHPELRQVLVEMLGFAALGSIADVVPLIDENRVIVKHGLRQIPHCRNEGLRSL
ncbi:MAG: DHH family phosphoesterase, partial [Phycisphaerales bacterium]